MYGESHIYIYICIGSLPAAFGLPPFVPTEPKQVIEQGIARGLVTSAELFGTRGFLKNQYIKRFGGAKPREGKWVCCLVLLFFVVVLYMYKGVWACKAVLVPLFQVVCNLHTSKNPYLKTPLIEDPSLTRTVGCFGFSVQTTSRQVASEQTHTHIHTEAPTRRDTYRDTHTQHNRTAHRTTPHHTTPHHTTPHHTTNYIIAHYHTTHTHKHHTAQRRNAQHATLHTNTHTDTDRHRHRHRHTHTLSISLGQG